MILTFDIETLPTNDQEVIDQLRATIKPPATHKKPETIAAWMEENAESALAELVAKTSFDGMYGRVACIAWGIDGHDVLSTQASHTEKEAIQFFFKCVEEVAQFNDTFCGHNIAGFDLPFLKHRAIVLGIKPPTVLMRAMNSKPWDNCIADTMLMWHPDRDKRASIDKLCRVLGIPGKGDFDGSMVAETWPVDPQKVIDYCKDDVRRTVQIYNRLTFAGV